VRAAWGAVPGLIAGRACSVVSGLPPTPHRPLRISWIAQRVIGRMPSPPTRTTASANSAISACFCASSSTPSMIFTSMNGIVLS